MGQSADNELGLRDDVRAGILALYVTQGRQVASTNKQQPDSFWKLLKQIHQDKQGGVSIETILIIAAIAIPILIFIIKFGWPQIKTWFTEGMDELEGGMDDAAGA